MQTWFSWATFLRFSTQFIYLRCSTQLRDIKETFQGRERLGDQLEFIQTETVL